MNNDSKLKHLTLIFPAFVIFLVLTSLIISCSSTNHQADLTDRWSSDRTRTEVRLALSSDSSYIHIDSTGKHTKVFTKNISY